MRRGASFSGLLASSPFWFRAAFVAIVVLIAGSLIASPVIAYTTRHEMVATVTDKNRVCTGTGSGDSASVDCRYLIFTDQTTFENTDTIWYMKWDSSDIYGHIVVGRQYRFTLIGFRVPFLSMYPNIISMEPVT